MGARCMSVGVRYSIDDRVQKHNADELGRRRRVQARFVVRGNRRQVISGRAEASVGWRGCLGCRDWREHSARMARLAD